MLSKFKLAALLPVIAAGAANAQSSSVRVAALPGTTTLRATVPGDTTQAYALYLPTAYVGDARLPVLFVLDPRGRGDLGLALFAPAAERLGYIVISSYNSRSDTIQSVSIAAINAMLEVAQTLRVADKRMYLAGMSGTGRQALRFSIEVRPHVAGVISSAAGLLPAADPFEVAYAGDSTVAVVTTTGESDFNYAEVRRTEERLRAVRIPVLAAFGKGGHGWPPESVCAKALEWLELRAMLGGRRPVDSAWVSTHLDGRLKTARELEDHRQLDDARRAYDAVARDVPRWPQGISAAAQAERLASLKEVRDLEKRLRESLDLEADYTRQMTTTLIALRQESAMESPSRISKRLGLPELLRRVERSDSVETPAVRRVLAKIQAQLSFYEPRAYVAAGQHERALSLLATSELIAPLAGGESCVLLDRARKAAGGWESLGRSCQRRPPLPSDTAGMAPLHR